MAFGHVASLSPYPWLVTLSAATISMPPIRLKEVKAIMTMMMMLMNNVCRDGTNSGDDDPAASAMATMRTFSRNLPDSKETTFCPCSKVTRTWPACFIMPLHSKPSTQSSCKTITSEVCSPREAAFLLTRGPLGWTAPSPLEWRRRAGAYHCETLPPRGICP